MGFGIRRCAAVAAALALAVAPCACGGDGGSGAGAGGHGGGASSAGGGGASSSSGGHGGSGASGGGGAGAGGGGPTGTPYAYVGADDGKIRVYSFDAATGALSLLDTTDAGQNPSFLAFSPDHRFVYAGDEGTSQIGAFAIDAATGKLTPLNAVSSNGNDPAHVAIDATGKFVFGTNYGGGNVTVLPVQGDGSLGAPVTTLATGANAHELVLDASNQFAFVPNKGADTVSQLVFDPSSGALVPNATPTVDFPAGSGPRHLAFHPTAPFAYVIDETDDTMWALSYDAPNGHLHRIMSLPTIPSSFDGSMNTCAEVAFGKSGRFLYGSNRGHDSIVIFEVDPNTGALSLVGYQPTSGSTPRHFSIEPSGEILLVANQQSNDVVTFRIDASTGKLSKLLVTDVPAAPGYVGVIYLQP